MTWAEIGTVFVSGGVAGSLATLATPFAKDAVRKRREQRERQRQMMNSWRDGIASLPDDCDTAHIGARSPLLSLAWFLELDQYLTDQERHRINGVAADGITPRFFLGDDRYLARRLSEAVKRIGQDWD